MKGHVEVYKGFMDGTDVKFQESPVYREDNLIVDGAKEHVVDMLTRIPSPSSTFGSVSSIYDISNFVVHGFSVSPNESAFLRCNGLAAKFGYQVTAAGGQVGYRDLDPSDGTAWSYLPDIPNFSFSEVNAGFSGSVYPNNSLSNPTFTTITNVLINPKFRNYSIDDSLSAVHLNIVLGLYELDAWGIRSCLRYVNLYNEYMAGTRCGSLARHNISEISAVSAIIAQGYAEPDDGVLFARSFATSNEGQTSGSVNLSQQFVPYVSGLSRSVASDESLGVLAEISAKYYSISGGANASILVYLQDKTTGERYDFSGSRHTWNSSGHPLIFNATKDVSSCISFFVNIPNTRMSNRFELTYQFASHDNDTDILECYFWDAGVSLMDGWLYGHIAQNDSVQRVISGDYGSPSLYMNSSGVDTTKTGSELPLSSTTYISQLFSMSPLKKYSGFLFGDLYGSISDTDHYLDIGVLKKFSSDSRVLGKFNYLTDLSANQLIETNFGTHVVAHPLLNNETLFSLPLAYSVDAKPDDLCLEVSSLGVVSGIFALPVNKPAIFRGDVLKNFKGLEGVSAVDIYFTLRTTALDSSGNYRYFDFTTGDWDSTPLTVSVPERNKFSTSATTVNAIGDQFASFQVSPLINPNLLQGVVSSIPGTLSFALALTAHNVSGVPGFIKNLRMDSYAKTYAEDIQDYFDWSAINGASRWVVHDNSLSGQYTFSDVTTIEYSQTSGGSGVNFWGLSCLDNMNFASGTTHTSSSEYQIAIFNTRNDDSAGGFQQISAVGLCDVALMPYKDSVKEGTWTSESYLPTAKFDLMGGPHVQYMNSVSSVSSYGGSFPGATCISPTSGLWDLWPAASAANIYQTNQGFLFGALKEGPVVAERPDMEVCHIFRVKDITLPVSSTQIAFSLKYQQYSDAAAGSPPTTWTAMARLDDGSILYWNAPTSLWGEVFYGSGIPYNSFITDFRRGSDNPDAIKTIFSTKIDIVDARFTPTTKIRIAISQSSIGVDDVTVIKDWEFYRISPFPADDLPAFPTPMDRTVQPPSTESGGSLGQYTNALSWTNFYGSALPGVTLDRAYGNQGWVPGSGTVLSGVVMSGYSPGYSVVNSDGVIYPVTGGPVANSLPGDPLAFSGFQASAGSTSVTYWFDVVNLALPKLADLAYFDFQGGIGGVGLWVLDVDATFKKLIDGGYGTELYVTPATQATPLGGVGLYNLTDPGRNLVYKLFAKKVFRTPIKGDSGDEKAHSVRFKWTIEFLS